MQVSNVYRYNKKVNLKRGVASKVTYIFGDEDEALCVEGTPDFYARTTHPFHPKIVYLLIGECESQGSDYPEMQLAITIFGHLIYRPSQKCDSCNSLHEKPPIRNGILGNC